jgi:putative ABC transport system permease protein
MWQYAWRETIRRKGRTAGNVLGFFLAVAIMVVLVSTLLFSNETHSAVLTSTGTHFIGFVPQCVSETCSVDLLDEQNEGFIANGSPAKLIPTQLVEEIRALPSVADASPYLLFKFQDPEDDSIFTVGGFDLNSPVSTSSTVCSAAHLIQGRFLQPGDTGLVILEESYAVAKLLLVGFPVIVAGETFTVAGIVDPGIRPGKADIYMSFEDANRVINKRLATPIQYQANTVLVESASSTLHEQAMVDVQKVLGSRSLVSIYGCYLPAAEVLGINENMLWPLVIIIGISAIGFALKSQFSSVIERRHDIGIMKSIGWSDSNVLSQIMGESVIQAAIGGVLGVLAAVIVLLVVPFEVLSGIETTAAAGTTVTISPIVVLSALGLSLLGGIIAGILPAMVAARTRPADSLRRL